jgi:hypothetical protein
MKAILRAEKGEEFLFFTIFADSYCIRISRWTCLRVVDAAIAHAASMFMAIMLILQSSALNQY